MLSGCTDQTVKVRPDDIIGNWYFIDKDYSFDSYYHEAYIDSSNIHLNLGFSLWPSYHYKIERDTIFLVDQEMRPFMVVKKACEDTLIMELLPYQVEKTSRTLTYIRFDDTEKGIFDYDAKSYKNNLDSMDRVYNSDVYRRYEEYLIAIGKTTREQLESEKNDSSNYVIFDSTEITDENDD